LGAGGEARRDAGRRRRVGRSGGIDARGVPQPASTRATPAAALLGDDAKTTSLGDGGFQSTCLPVINDRTPGRRPASRRCCHMRRRSLRRPTPSSAWAATWRSTPRRTMSFRWTGRSQVRSSARGVRCAASPAHRCDELQAGFDGIRHVAAGIEVQAGAILRPGCLLHQVARRPDRSLRVGIAIADHDPESGGFCEVAQLIGSRTPRRTARSRVTSSDFGPKSPLDSRRQNARDASAD
jgi:hypothetical protein